MSVQGIHFNHITYQYNSANYYETSLFDYLFFGIKMKKPVGDPVGEKK
jgi:hypothetical protein